MKRKKIKSLDVIKCAEEKTLEKSAVMKILNKHLSKHAIDIMPDGDAKFDAVKELIKEIEQL